VPYTTLFRSHDVRVDDDGFQSSHLLVLQAFSSIHLSLQNPSFHFQKFGLLILYCSIGTCFPVGVGVFFLDFSDTSNRIEIKDITANATLVIIPTIAATCTE